MDRYENEAHESVQDEESKNADEGSSIDQNMLKISLQEELARIPLSPIPYSKNDSPDVRILNELGIESGRFGWCIVCRNTSDLYCKETKHPVCS
jgi:brefeldin A-inhibited guanine nucleotide-exchange protein